MANKQMFKALVMVELVNSEEEEETKGRGLTRSWLRSWTSSSVHFFLPFLIVPLFPRLFLHFANPFCKTKETTDRMNSIFE